MPKKYKITSTIVSEDELIRENGCIEVYTLEADYYTFPILSQVEVLPITFTPGDRLRLHNYPEKKYVVVDGPVKTEIMDTESESYLVMTDKGIHKLIREDLLEKDDDERD